MKNLPTPYQDFIHKSRYARWNEEEKRREDWMRLSVDTWHHRLSS